MANNFSKISTLIPSQVPFFVQNDHAQFVAFLEAYYEYLEQFEAETGEGKVVERSRNFLNYIDIDKTIDDFTDNLYDTFLHGMPNEIAGDKALILKNAKDFFRSKGSEKSVRFLMRAIFGKEIEFYYPKSDVLRVSDGKWYIRKSIRITETEIDGVANNALVGIEKYIGRTVTGNTSNALAVVESVDRYFDKGVQIDELVLSGIKGVFRSGETINAVFDEANEFVPINSIVFGGFVNNILITQGGANYVIGDPVIITSNTGTGATAEVSRVSTGNIVGITVGSSGGGAGYMPMDQMLITGGGGFGAQAEILLTDKTGTFHANVINITSSLIGLEANTPLGNAIFSNLSGSNANTAVANAVAYFTFSNVGPARVLSILDPGFGFTSLPSITAIGNTRIRALGMLGRMDILDRGAGYALNDTIEFINYSGSFGTGAQANVTQVNGTGAIMNVYWKTVPGFPPGGTGFSPELPPRANVITVAGTGANINVTVMGYGGEFVPINSTIGAVEEVNIITGGTGYDTLPDVDFTGSGDGNARGTAVIVEGVITYPGRYLNDDGQISALNYLQDRDYYQNHSYVIRVKESIENYRKYLKELTHPAGMKVFGEHLVEDNAEYGYDEVTITTPIQTIEYTPALYLNFESNTANAFWNVSVTEPANVISISRSSPGYAQNTDGHWIVFANNELRRTDKGVLVEEARTNYIRNALANGSAGGTALPTGWGMFNNDSLSVEYLGTWNEQGVSGINVRFFGTTSGISGSQVQFDALANVVPATVGTLWSTSAFVGIANGSLANVNSFRLALSERSNINTQIGFNLGPNVTANMTSSVQRLEFSNTALVSNVFAVNPRLYIGYPTGRNIDVTLKIGWPQIEEGNNVTSPILTGNGASNVRLADAITVPTPDRFINFGANGASYIKWIEGVGQGENTNRTIWSAYINGNAYIRNVIGTNGSIGGAIFDNGGAGSAQMFSSNVLVKGNTYSAAMRWKPNDFAIRLTPGLGNPANDTVGNVATGTYTLHVGSFNGGQQLNGYVQEMILYQTAVSDTYLTAYVS